MASQSSLALGLLLLVSCVSWGSATDYTVGDSSGLATGVDYTTWVSGKTFNTGDTLTSMVGHCSGGMKLATTVTPAASTPSTTPKTTPSTITPTPRTPPSTTTPRTTPGTTNPSTTPSKKSSSMSIRSVLDSAVISLSELMGFVLVAF